MTIPAQTALFPTLTMESLLLGGVSVVPSPWPLAMFCTGALQIPELSNAPVRQVLCNRQGVHEFILLNCDVNTVAGNVITLWFRIERRPRSQGVGVLLNKPKPAMDTIMASTNLQALRDPCESRDSFLYSPHANPRVVLKFKHIAEMCRYFTGHSSEYSLLGANCRWICYALLECLREAEPCYGGTWLPSRGERPTADVRAAQLAKSHYLQDKHSACCGRQYLDYPNLGPQIANAGAGLASIAVANASQNTHNGDSQDDQDVIYSTPGSSSKAAAPHHEPSTLATNTGGNFSSGVVPQTLLASGASLNNTASSNPTRMSSGTSTTHLNRNQNDMSPLPAGANIAHYPQSSPVSMSEDMSNLHSHQHTTTPPVKHNAPQPDGAVTSVPHCSGCQCTTHTSHRQSAPSDSRPRPTRLQCSLANSRNDDTFDLASQLSSMSLRSDTSIPESSHGQWIGENAFAPREAQHSGHQCSSCNSFVPTCSIDSRRIYPDLTQQSVISPTSAGSRQHNDTVSISTRHPSCHGQCSSHVNLGNNPSVTQVPRTQRVSGGSNAFKVPQQRLSQFSFSSSAPSMEEVAPGCTAHHNRVSSLGTGCLSYDPQAPIHAQGCHHTHNCSPPEPFHGSSCSASHNYSSSHTNDSWPRQAHETAPIPAVHQGVRGNSQAYTTTTQSRSSTGTSNLTSGSYTHSPSPPFPRDSLNGNGLYQFQEALHDHTHVPPSPMRQNGNAPEQHYHHTQPNLYNIPEEATRSGLDNRWGVASEPFALDLSSAYGAQTMLPNHAPLLPLSNPPAQVAPNYPYGQHSDTVVQQPYVPSGPPANPYSRPGPPNRGWTQEVWGNQEFGLPMRTNSPTQLESPLMDDIYSPPQPQPSMLMPDHRNYI